MKMWYANKSDSRKRNGGASAPEGSRRDRRASGGAGEAQSHQGKTHRPQETGVGVSGIPPAAENFGGWDVCNSPEREQGPPRGHRCALGPCSGHQPADPRRAPASPQQFLPPPHFNNKGGKYSISNPTGHRGAAPHANQVHPTRVPACVLSPGPHAAPVGHTRPTPPPNLLVRVCFFGHFPVHLDACPGAGSFAPFIFLSAHPGLHISGDRLIWLGRGDG